MIRLLLDPPRFECETAQDAADLARLMGIKATAAPEFSVYSPLSIEPMTVTTSNVSVHPQGRMKPTGNKKTCKTCGREFPIVDRTDCAAVYCKACRPPQIPRKNPKPPVPAAGRGPRLPIKPSEPKAKCRTCGDTMRAFEQINGECLDCAPMGAKQGVA